MEQRLEIEWRPGRAVSAALNSAPGTATARAGLVLAHGAGGDLETPLLATIAEASAGRGFPVLRFNFPYRQIGRRGPDPASTLEECYLAVARRAEQLVAPGRLLLGGKSLGGRMASHLAARLLLPVAGLVFLGYPLHPPGRPEKLRDQHLAAIQAPMLFVAGTRDAFAERQLLQSVLKRLQPLATVHWIEGADHSFRAPGRRAADVQDEIVDVVAEFLNIAATK